MDLDSLISQIEGKKPAAANATGTIDIDAILKNFDIKPDIVAKPVEPKKTSQVAGEPRPPISGLSKEASDEINATRAEKGGENPRRKLPTTNIKESIVKDFNDSREMLGSAFEDSQSGHPYKGLGKGALGIFQMITSPVSGAIEGGVSTPITDITGNKSIGDRAGIVASGAVPIVPGGSAVVKALPKNKMLRRLVEHIGPENLGAMVQELKTNSRLAPADLSPKVLQSTQELFAAGGPVNYLKGTSEARMAGAKGVIETAYDSATGLPVNGVTKLKELKKAASDVGSGLIQPALKDAKPVNIQPVLDHIDNIVKPGVNKVLSVDSTLPSTEINKQLGQVRAMLANAKEQRTDPKALHEFQSVLRQTADELLNSMDGASKRMGKALMNVRNELVNTIDTAAGGTYKPALSKYRDAKQIDDAFYEGYTGVFTNSKKLEGRPEFTEEWFKGLSDAEKAAAKEGARLQLDTTIHNTRFAARKGMEVPEADFNRKKLELLFGKEETNKLVKTLHDERTIANTHNKIVEGSQTAMRDASKSEWKAPTPTEVGQGLVIGAGMETANILAHGYPGVGTSMLMGAKAGGKGKDWVKGAVHRENQAQYAKYALPTEGPSRDELIRSLEALIPQPKLSMFNKARAALPASKP